MSEQHPGVPPEERAGNDGPERIEEPPPPPEQPRPSQRPDWASRGVDVPGQAQPTQPIPEPTPQPVPEPTGPTPQPTPQPTPEPSYPAYEEIEDYPAPSVGFSARRELASLKFDLRPYVEAYGVVPEPTEARLDRFREFEIEILEEGNRRLNITTTRTDEQGNEIIDIEAMQGILNQDRQISRKMRSAVGDLCGGTPSQQHIHALPPRIFSKFYGWLRGELGEA